LLADDGEANRQLIQVVLARAGLEVVPVENGQQAVDQASNGHFDLVLMDMQMPVMDGYTASSRLRQLGFAGPIIALTAHAMIGDEEKCRAAGCSGYLSKPVSIEKLLELLANELGEGEPGATVVGPILELPAIFEGGPAFLTPSWETYSSAQDGVPVPPIHSSLLDQDPSFREIVAGFVDKLAGQFDAMETAFQRRDFAQLASLAHWLKGSAGTLGFAVFTEPAKKLEQLAKKQQVDELPRTLALLRRMAAAIVVPETTPARV
jgi:CheY-like chemotaxis protein